MTISHGHALYGYAMYHTWSCWILFLKRGRITVYSHISQAKTNSHFVILMGKKSIHGLRLCTVTKSRFTRIRKVHFTIHGKKRGLSRITKTLHHPLTDGETTISNNFSLNPFPPNACHIFLNCFKNVQGRSNFWVCWRNASVWPFKWKFLSSTSMQQCWKSKDISLVDQSSSFIEASEHCQQKQRNNSSNKRYCLCVFNQHWNISTSLYT